MEWFSNFFQFLKIYMFLLINCNPCICISIIRSFRSLCYGCSRVHHSGPGTCPMFILPDLLHKHFYINKEVKFGKPFFQLHFLDYRAGDGTVAAILTSWSQSWVKNGTAPHSTVGWVDFALFWISWKYICFAVPLGRIKGATKMFWFWFKNQWELLYL